MLNLQTKKFNVYHLKRNYKAPTLFKNLIVHTAHCAFIHLLFFGFELKLLKLKKYFIRCCQVRYNIILFITHYFRHHGNGGGGMAGSVGDARQVHGESSANPLHLNTTASHLSPTVHFNNTRGSVLQQRRELFIFIQLDTC